MRIHEGNYAYDVELQRDPSTQLPLKWRFVVYRLRPVETPVADGDARTREEAEVLALNLIHKLEKAGPERAA